MSKLYRSREGDITAVDTKTQLTTLSSETAPGPLLVPGGMKYVTMARVIAMADLAVATDSAYIVRLEGPGLKDGPAVFTAGASGVAVATGGHGSLPSTGIPLGLEVVPNQEILVFAENVGEDAGTETVGVTLTFASDLAGLPAAKGLLTVEGDVNAIDTLVRLTAQGSVTAPSRITPPTAKKIQRIIAATGNDGLAAGQAAMLIRLGGTAIKNGEQTLFIGGHSSQTVQSGSDAGPSLMGPVVIEDVDIEINPSENLDISAEHAGVDVGDTTVAVTVVYA